MTTLLIVSVLALQAIVAGILNIVLETRTPKSIGDFLLLITLPYIIYCGLFNRDRLQ